MTLTKVLCVFIVLLLLPFVLFAGDQPSKKLSQWSSQVARKTKSYAPPNGVVPDEKTATRIGEAVISAAYGEEMLRSELPLRVELDKGVWTVVGTLQRGVRGGTAIIRISQKDGRVLYLGHEQ